MCHPRTILRMSPVTLRGLGCSHEYVVGHRTGDSRLRGNDVGGLGMFWPLWRPRSPCTLQLPLICPSKGYAKVSEGGNLALRTRHAMHKNTRRATHRTDPIGVGQ